MSPARRSLHMLLRRAGTIDNAEPNLDPGPALRMNQRFAEGDTNPATIGEQSCLFSESAHLGRSVGDLHHTLEFDLGSVPWLRRNLKFVGVIESPTIRGA